jgi:hypothetical protein
MRSEYIRRSGGVTFKGLLCETVAGYQGRVREIYAMDRYQKTFEGTQQPTVA